MKKRHIILYSSTDEMASHSATLHRVKEKVIPVLAGFVIKDMFGDSKLLQTKLAADMAALVER